MEISFPSEKQTIKTFVANLHRCKGCIRKGQSHISKMPSPSRQPLIPRNVGTKQKRIIDSDDEGDVNKLYNLNTSAFNCFKLKNSARLCKPFSWLLLLYSRWTLTTWASSRYHPTIQLHRSRPQQAVLKQQQCTHRNCYSLHLFLELHSEKRSERMNIWCLGENHCRKEATICRNDCTAVWPISKKQWKRDRL